MLMIKKRDLEYTHGLIQTDRILDFGKMANNLELGNI